MATIDVSRIRDGRVHVRDGGWGGGGLIIANVQEANMDNSEMPFYKAWCVECTYLNRIDEVIRMSTHNIHFHDIMRKFS